MGDFSHPSKKPRLDQTNEASDWESAANDDLWGQDELTAEEFDFLESQATQLVGDKGINALNVNQVGQTSANLNTSAELDRLKLEQYALEGKNKALTQSLEKTVEELNSERINRDLIINQNLADLKQKEVDLLKEIDKLQTALLFQEQETRTERSKIYILENKLKENKKQAQVHANGSFHETSIIVTPVKKSSSKALHWNSFDHGNHTKTNESGVQTEVLRHRKFPLSLQVPRGEMSEDDVLRKLLACRIMDSFLKSDSLHISEGNTGSRNEICKISRDSSSMSVAMLRCMKESDSVWKPYEAALQEYIRHLNIERNSLKLVLGKVYIFSDEGMPSLDLNRVQNGILTCLRDLTRLLFHQCPKETSGNLKEFYNIKSEKNNNSEALSQNSMSLFDDEEEKMDIRQRHGCRLQELVIMLANPITYPNDYKMTYEIEWALAALVAWSSHSKESLEPYIKNLPLHSLVCANHGLECAYLAVKLMVQLIGLKSLKETLVHLSDSTCIMCSIGKLCLYVHSESNGNPVHCMNVVVTFLSGALTCYGFTIIKQESFPCSSQILKGVVTMLLRQMRTIQECNVEQHVPIIQKGVTLLYFLSTQLPKFRAERHVAEENYIALIGGLAKLCKENHAFKKIQDIVRDMWDFQDDSSEFDSEDVPCTQNDFLQASAAF